MGTSGSARVGVLTFHRCINYGSYWQARCLVQGLRGMGHTAELIDHDSSAVNRSEWRCALQPLLPEKVPADQSRLYGTKARAFHRALRRVPHSPRFPLDEPGSVTGYEAVVVGSDEVWNLRHPWYGGKPLFYGEGLKARRLVAYAASFGNQSAAEGLDRFWAEKLGAFDAISVRDENSREILHGATAQDAALVLDPCLLFPEPARSPASSSRVDVAVYGHSFPDWFATAIRNWADARRLRLVSIGYANRWADEQRIAEGPEQFAEIMSGAGAVVTNFFHGAVFALLNAKPLACVPSPYRYFKLTGLARKLGIEDRLLAGPAGEQAIGRLLREPPGGAVQNRIETLRQQSMNFLSHALG